MQELLINGIVHTGNEVIRNASVLVEEGRVVSLFAEQKEGMKVTDLQGKQLAPGFIDIQLNGGEQYYFSQDTSAAALQDMYDSSKRYGVTHILPCLISSPREKILEAIEVVRSFREKNPGVLGMHLEGPFINPVKRGAHQEKVIRRPTNAELEEIIRYGRDVIKVITIAPEMFNDEQLDMLKESGIIISAGHSDMNFEQADACFKKGISLVTHLYNAMKQMGHREPGIVGAVFENEHVYAPVILDGAHCHYAAANIAYRLKKDKLLLLSDAAFLGRKKQSFQSELLDATLQDGFYRNSEGNLAGAAISMAEAVYNAVHHADIPLQEAIKMAGSRVANALGMADRIGKIAPGYPASFVCFDETLTTFEVMEL
ncbi:MAG: N-acetylglucosamine-6-phosphate deacetylase [Ferruginibacter sp.]